MEALIKAFTKFLYRDVVFALGGSAIILTLLHAFEKIPCPQSSIAAYKYIAGAGVSYAIGYAVQDFLTMLGLVRTKARLAPNRFGKFLYERFEGDRPEHQTFSVTDYEEARHWVYTKAAQRYRDNLERIESLKQVGTVLGPCFAISGLILLIAYFNNHKNPFDLTIAVAAVVLGLVLWALGWLKVTQQAQYVLEWRKIAKSEPTYHYEY